MSNVSLEASVEEQVEAENKAAAVSPEPINQDVAEAEAVQPEPQTPATEESK